MNTVRGRLMLALTILLVTFLGALSIWQRLAFRNADLILANSSHDKAGAVASIIKANSLALRGLATDCAQNKDVAYLLSNRKTTTISAGLAETLRLNRVSDVWIFRPHAPKIHWTSPGSQASAYYPLTDLQLARMVQLRADAPSFILTRNGLVELAAGRIVEPHLFPSSKPAYIVLERSWNGSYLNTIKALSGCGITLAGLGQGATPPSLAHALTLRRLTDPSGTPIAWLYLTGDTTLVELINGQQSSTLALFASFAIGVLGFLLFGIIRWVSRPLDAISTALESENTDGLRELSKDRSDFGRLAVLVKDFFGQNRRLVGEVADRRRAEDELRHAREELEVRVRERTAELLAANEAMRLEVAERLRTVDALRFAEAKYRSIFENSVEGIFQMTPDGIVFDSNPAFSRILGHDSMATESLSTETKPTNIPYVDADRRATFNRIIEQVDVVRDFEVEAYRVSGELTWLSINARVVRDERGEVLFYEGTIEDVSERKRTESEIMRLNSSLEDQISRIVALRRIDIAIGASHDLSVTLQIFLTEMQSQLGVDAAAVLLCDQSTMTLRYAGCKGFRTNALMHTQLTVGFGQAGQSALNRRKIHIPDLRLDMSVFGQSLAFQDEDFVAYIAVPLIAKGQVKGVLEVFHRGQLETNFEWLDFLDALAGQAAIAIDNASLFENLQRSNEELTLAYDATIEGWSRALDLRDKETEGHSKRVTEMAVRLGHRLGLSDAELVHIRRGSLLHDIGKMGIPDQILLKPAPLAEHEWHIMRKHPTYAYEMLHPVDFLRPALDIPYCHHEKWDGTGYPRNLVADQIPIAARIFALVDVWDALRSDRPYRSSWPEQQVIDHIKALSGTHFDPAVVSAFVAMIDCDRDVYAPSLYLDKAA